MIHTSLQIPNWCLMITLAMTCVAVAAVSLDSLVLDNMDVLRIKTDNATYHFQKEAGAISSILDRDGSDWVSWNEEAGHKGMNRGIPNLGGPVFHPGEFNHQTEIEEQTPEKIRLRVKAYRGTWECTWDFYSDHATFTLLKTVGVYWFLYEGTPGGKLDVEKDFFVVAPGEKHSCKEVIKEMILPKPGWVYFGDPELNRALFLIHHDGDDLIDSYWPMSTMTVWGFGRGYQYGPRYMKAVPNRFSIGLVENSDQKPAIAKIQQVIEATDTK